MVGLNYSMMRTLGIFKNDTMLTLSNLSSNIGLSYALFGPLLRGASTFLIEDPWAFSKRSIDLLVQNKIKTLFIHSYLLEKTL